MNSEKDEKDILIDGVSLSSILQSSKPSKSGKPASRRPSTVSTTWPYMRVRYKKKGRLRNRVESRMEKDLSPRHRITLFPSLIQPTKYY